MAGYYTYSQSEKSIAPSSLLVCFSTGYKGKLSASERWMLVWWCLTGTIHIIVEGESSMQLCCTSILSPALCD